MLQMENQALMGRLAKAAWLEFKLVISSTSTLVAFFSAGMSSDEAMIQTGQQQTNHQPVQTLGRGVFSSLKVI